MHRIKIHFYKGTRFFSRLIQWRTFSKYSHVSIQIDDKIYEAKEWKWVVSCVAKKQPPKSLVETFEIVCTREDILKWETWLKSQLNKKYDYLGLLWFLIRPKSYRKNDKWFCSELWSYFLYLIWKIDKPKHLISPWELYNLLYRQYGSSTPQHIRN